MDKETKDVLINIEKHLKALVNLLAINMQDKKIKAGYFNKPLKNSPEHKVFSIDSANAYLINIVRDAYKDIEKMQTYEERRGVTKKLNKGGVV